MNEEPSDKILPDDFGLGEERPPQEESIPLPETPPPGKREEQKEPPAPPKRRERKLVERSALEKFARAARVVWGSKFMMLLFALVVSAVFCGLDFEGGRKVYLVAHGILVVLLGRCIYLQFTSKSEDDDALRWLTGQRD